MPDSILSGDHAGRVILNPPSRMAVSMDNAKIQNMINSLYSG